MQEKAINLTVEDIFPQPQLLAAEGQPREAVPAGSVGIRGVAERYAVLISVQNRLVLRGISVVGITLATLSSLGAVPFVVSSSPALAQTGYNAGIVRGLDVGTAPQTVWTSQLQMGRNLLLIEI